MLETDSMTGIARAKSILDVTSSMAVIAGVAALLWMQFFRAVPAPQRIGPIAISGTKIETARIRHLVGTSKIVLIEFADFECPVCYSYAAKTHPKLKREFIDTGRLSYAFVNFPLSEIHLNALRSSYAAECADKSGKYWQMLDRLFSRERSLSTTGLMTYADDIGLTAPAFSKCLNGEVASAIQSDVDMGRQLDVAGTPTFFLGTLGSDGVIALAVRFNGLTSYEALGSAVASLGVPSPDKPTL